ncbi:MAG: hypothetical protein SPL51_06565 [Lachnospiraceae bacterium]|nr:hypothetical protein [Bovifimicola ammoniilytica]MCI5602450.1 hypothetical protein [Clostridiales bacterium]MCU6752794.1 hypothetical protein [Bovifimicola ammoniilytica]MDD6292717.1 hypothetical protein [Eubacteriales bacterium]MDY6329129.1 hypothetical protein [Lachnospiraceae bacterium]
MKIIPEIIPITLADRKLEGSLEELKNISNIVRISIGKNNNFKCSQVDSFVAEKSPTIGLLPDHS